MCLRRRYKNEQTLHRLAAKLGPAALRGSVRAWCAYTKLRLVFNAAERSLCRDAFWSWRWRAGIDAAAKSLLQRSVATLRHGALGRSLHTWLERARTEPRVLLLQSVYSHWTSRVLMASWSQWKVSATPHSKRPRIASPAGAT